MIDDKYPSVSIVSYDFLFSIKYSAGMDFIIYAGIIYTGFDPAWPALQGYAYTLVCAVNIASHYTGSYSFYAYYPARWQPRHCCSQSHARNFVVKLLLYRHSCSAGGGTMSHDP